MRKLAKLAAIAFLVFYVVTQPAQSASVVHSIGHGLQSAATGFGQFVSNLA